MERLQRRDIGWPEVSRHHQRAAELPGREGHHGRELRAVATNVTRLREVR